MSDSPPIAHRAGFVALLGRPNVGKSTLLNALVGKKLSIVTPKPQTTRNRVLGVVSRPDYQMAFVDTPGLHFGSTRALNRAMNRTAASAALDADVIAWVVEALRFTHEDQLALDRALEAQRPMVVVINKIDRVNPRDRLLPFIAEMAGRKPETEIVLVSAERDDGLDQLLAALARQLPESPSLFPEGETDEQNPRFRISECIREKLTLELNEEVPYGIAVQVESMQDEDGQLAVSAIIWVDRSGQKPIVIGRNGERLKRIGTRARQELNEALGQRLHLTLWVKVREDWADNAEALRQLGME